MVNLNQGLMSPCNIKKYFLQFNQSPLVSMVILPVPLQLGQGM